MQDYIAVISSDPKVKYRITKSRCGHMVQAMKLGGDNSFDREAFSCLAPFARQDGIDLVDFTPAALTKQGGPVVPLIRVRWIYT